MIPILFNHDATSFTTHGIGDLMETTACESIVNADGEYELELQYPADGPMIPYLLINNIIVAKVNDHGANQAFRIYGISKAINSLVTVKCQHLSYDLSCAPAMHYESTTCSGALRELKNHAVGGIANPFTFYTDIPDSQKALNQDQKFKMEESTTVRAALLDGDDSIKGCWGGDLVFDNYSVSLLKVAGADRGVLVEYGIDLMDMEQEENISEMVTGVFPYWKGREEGDDPDADDKIVYGAIQYASGTFQRQRIIPLNVTEYYPNNTSAPTTAQIEQTARDWMAANDVGVPVINLTLSYAELGKDVRLHDAITVRFVKIGIDHKAKVISYKYDTLKERCIEVQVGNVKPSILFSLEDASRLKRGLIPPKRIANNSITSDHIENYGISGSNLGTGAVGTRSLDDEAVTNEKVGKWAIEEYNLGPLSVSSAKIQNGAVGNVQLGNAAVTHDKIGNGEIYEANLGNSSVTSLKIKDGEIKEAKIANGAVVTGKLANGAVTTAKVADLAIDSAKIGNSAITSVKIQNAAVDADKIKDGAVIEAKVSNAAITTQKVADLAIDEAKIGNSAITSVKIKDGEVVEGKIGNQAVSFDKVKDANIDQLKLNDFSITSEKIADGDWAYNYATKQWERRDPAVGTYALQNSAVVTAKIGDYEVANIKLVQTTQDAIAAVWEIDTLVSNNIDSRGINTNWASIIYLEASTVSASYVNAQENFAYKGSIVSTASIDNHTVLCI